MLGGILTQVTTLVTNWTATLATNLAALITKFGNQTQGSIDAAIENLDDQVSDAVAAAEAAEAAAQSAGAKPPIASGLIGIPTDNASLGPMGVVTSSGVIAELTAACTTFDTWVDLVNYSGSGVLTLAAIYQISNSSSRDAQVEILIDGNSVYLSAANLFQTGADDNTGVVPVGLVVAFSTSYGGVSESPVYFSTSLQIRAKKTENAAGTVNIGARVRYQKWS